MYVLEERHMGLRISRAAWYHLSAVCIIRHTRIIPSAVGTLLFLL